MEGEGPQAFVLGAGLGTRLRPLTEFLPKPLVPVCNRPLISYAFDHLIRDIDAGSFMINTHHCPEMYGVQFPDGEYRKRNLSFRHEPVLLDTAGGIDNVRDWLPSQESFVVYNGDILTDLPLKEAWRHHCESGDAVTMVLRSRGDELRVGFDPETGRVIDLRGVLNPEWPLRYQFAGIYFVAPHFLPFLKPGKIESVVFPILEAIQAGGQVGGVVVDEGIWSDLGERDAYLASLTTIAEYLSPETKVPICRISPDARIATDARIDSLSWIGPGAEIGSGATVTESVVWSGGVVEQGASLERVVVRSGCAARGTLYNVDL